MEKEKKVHVPAYFEKRKLDDVYKDDVLMWQSNGKYWEDRANHNWGNLIRIYE